MMNSVCQLAKLSHVLQDSFAKVKESEEHWKTSAKTTTESLADQKTFEAKVILYSRIAAGIMWIAGGAVKTEGWWKQCLDQGSKLIPGLADGSLKFQERYSILLNGDQQNIMRELRRADQGNQSCEQLARRAHETMLQAMAAAARAV